MSSGSASPAIDTVGVVNDISIMDVSLRDTHGAVLLHDLVESVHPELLVPLNLEGLELGERLKDSAHGAHKSAEESGDVRGSDHKADKEAKLSPGDDAGADDGAGVPHGEPGDIDKESGGGGEGAERSVAEGPVGVVVLHVLLLGKAGGGSTTSAVHKAPDESEAENAPLDVTELTGLLVGDLGLGDVSRGSEEGDNVLEEAEGAGPGAEELADGDGGKQGDAESEEGELGVRKTALEIVVGATDNGVRCAGGLEERDSHVDGRDAKESGVDKGEHCGLDGETSSLDCFDHCYSLIVLIECVCIRV